MVHDARREAEFLAARPDVDASRIGFMGFSLGAKAAVYVAAFAPEIAQIVCHIDHQCRVELAAEFLKCE